MLKKFQFLIGRLVIIAGLTRQAETIVFQFLIGRLVMGLSLNRGKANVSFNSS